jgi:hypothetical protein
MRSRAEAPVRADGSSVPLIQFAERLIQRMVRSASIRIVTLVGELSRARASRRAISGGTSSGGLSS